MDESRTRHVPWYVHAFAACIAAIGISLGLIFGFGIRSAFAFEWGNETFPNTLADVTVTFNETITAPPDGLTNTWYVGNYYPMTNTAATPYPNQYAGATHIWMENYSTVQSGNPWYIYFNCGNSLSGVTYIPSGIDYGARLAYDAVAGWWGTANGNGPTVTFSSSGIGANASLYTNHSFIVWVVENSDYRSRYEGGTWHTPQIAVVQNAVAWVVPTENVEFTLVIEFRDTANGTWTTYYTESPGTYSGSQILSQSGYYRVKFQYFLSDVAHELILPDAGYFQTTVFVPTELSFGTYSVQNSNGQNVYIDAVVYMASSVKLQAKRSASSEWNDIGVSFFNPDSNATAQWRSTPFIPIVDYEYRMVATDSQGNTVTQLVGSIQNTTGAGSDTWSDVWNDAWNTLQPILNTFQQIFGALFGWIPQDLREFLLAIIVLLVVLGLISRIIP